MTARAYEPLFETLCDQFGDVELSDFDLRCSACRGTGHGVDDAPNGRGYRGCPDCQGTGQLLPPDDMRGEARTLDDMDAEDELRP